MGWRAGAVSGDLSAVTIHTPVQNQRNALTVQNRPSLLELLQKKIPIQRSLCPLHSRAVPSTASTRNNSLYRRDPEDKTLSSPLTNAQHTEGSLPYLQGCPVTWGQAIRFSFQKSTLKKVDTLKGIYIYPFPSFVYCLEQECDGWSCISLSDLEISGGAVRYKQPGSRMKQKRQPTAYPQTSFLQGKQNMLSNHLANNHGCLIHGILCLANF